MSTRNIVSAGALALVAASGVFPQKAAPQKETSKKPPCRANPMPTNDKGITVLDYDCFKEKIKELNDTLLKRPPECSSMDGTWSVTKAVGDQPPDDQPVKGQDKFIFSQSNCLVKGHMEFSPQTKCGGSCGDHQVMLSVVGNEARGYVKRTLRGCIAIFGFDAFIKDSNKITITGEGSGENHADGPPPKQVCDKLPATYNLELEREQ